MKYLKKYDIFKESVELEGLELTQKQLDDFKTRLKPGIDAIYKDTKDEKLIQTKEIALLGQDEEKRNPFAVKWSAVAKLKYDVAKLTDLIASTKNDITRSKLLLNDLTKDVRKLEDLKISNNVTTLNNKIKELAKKSAEVEKSEIDFNEFIEKKKKETDEGIKNSVNKEQK